VRSARADKNQPEIVDAFKSYGASVQHLHKVGEGCPDILVGYNGRSFPVEIKYGTGKLNDRQIRWHNEWNGDVYVVRSVEDVSNLMEELYG